MASNISMYSPSFPYLSPPTMSSPPTLSVGSSIPPPPASLAPSNISKSSSPYPLPNVATSAVSLAGSSAAPISASGTKLTYDGKRMRKAVVRRTVDYNSSIIQMLKKQFYSLYKNHYWELDPIQPDPSYIINLLPSPCYSYNPAYSITTKFVHVSTNKIRCPVNVVKWTPEGRRLITGSYSGEFTLWNGLTFNFETILQAHEQAVRSMAWSHNGNFLISGDHIGTIKYWQPNMNNVHMFQAHKDPVRDLSFSSTDAKFASCSDDGTIKIWDFIDSKEERCLSGHGWDVKNIQWHPTLSLVASGSKDNTVKLWDPRSARNLATIHGHKSTILDLKWNSNGRWLLTGGKDQLVKLYDIRKLTEMQSFKGHKKDVTSLSWHPHHETFFVSGSYDGSIIFWRIDTESELGTIENAHEQAIWTLDWHPIGHILVSGSNDNTTKFWTRSRPGDLTDEKETKIASGTILQPSSKHTEDEEVEEEEEFLPGFGDSVGRNYGYNNSNAQNSVSANPPISFYQPHHYSSYASDSSQHTSTHANAGNYSNDNYSQPSHQREYDRGRGRASVPSYRGRRK